MSAAVLQQASDAFGDFPRMRGAGGPAEDGGGWATPPTTRPQPQMCVPAIANALSVTVFPWQIAVQGEEKGKMNVCRSLTFLIPNLKFFNQFSFFCRKC